MAELAAQQNVGRKTEVGIILGLVGLSLGESFSSWERKCTIIVRLKGLYNICTNIVQKVCNFLLYKSCTYLVQCKVQYLYKRCKIFVHEMYNKCTTRGGPQPS